MRKPSMRDRAAHRHLGGLAAAIFTVSFASLAPLTGMLSVGNAVLWLTLSALSAMAMPAIWLQRGLLAA